MPVIIGTQWSIVRIDAMCCHQNSLRRARLYRCHHKCCVLILQSLKGQLEHISRFYILQADHRSPGTNRVVAPQQKVMLDFELAEIYGYTTKRFNEQVKNNIERFDEDFRFQLLREEFDNLRSKKSTSSWGGQDIFHMLLPNKEFTC